MLARFGDPEPLGSNHVVGLDDPPRRLLLGAGAVAQAREAGALRAAELEQWAELSASADFPQPIAAPA